MVSTIMFTLLQVRIFKIIKFASDNIIYTKICFKYYKITPNCLTDFHVFTGCKGG